MLKIVSTLHPPFAGSFEAAVRRALEAHHGELEVVITPAMDAAHAEVTITENGAWRAACFAPVEVGLEDLVSRIRRTFLNNTAAPDEAAS